MAVWQLDRISIDFNSTLGARCDRELRSDDLVNSRFFSMGRPMRDIQPRVNHRRTYWGLKLYSKQVKDLTIWKARVPRDRPRSMVRCQDQQGVTKLQIDCPMITIGDLRKLLCNEGQLDSQITRRSTESGLPSAIYCMQGLRSQVALKSER
jgi:hypothetical protein